MHMYVQSEGNVTVIIIFLLFSVLGMDFSAPSPSTLTFPSGSTAANTQCAMITLLSDNAVEGPHDFTVDLANPNPSSGTIGAQGSATVTIGDDRT